MVVKLESPQSGVIPDHVRHHLTEEVDGARVAQVEVGKVVGDVVVAAGARICAEKPALLEIIVS